MEPFKTVTGIVVPLDRTNIDTDSIVPARYLKRIERDGWGEFLFYDWRYLPDGTPNPKFELNRPGYENAKVLVGGRNFGSGSSREHAVWALVQYGIRAVIASVFADIFHKNCFENGLVPVIIPEEQVQQIMRRSREGPSYEITVDLVKCELRGPDDFSVRFVVHDDPETHEFRRNTLLHGLDEIALTLDDNDLITTFEGNRPPWLNPVTP